MTEICPVNRWHDGFMSKPATGFSLAIEYYREEDGRWMAEIESLPGVLAYGATKKEAQSKVEALALRVIAENIEREQSTAGSVRFAAA